MLQKKIKCLFAILLIGTSCFGQLANTLSYVASYKDIAIKEMKRTGIPASITLAQGIVESASGESNLAKKYNNHFGIKCKEDWKGEKTYQDDDKKNECFRVYTDALSSFKDHSNFLKSRPNYASLFQLDPVDDSAWAYGLKKAGYATASDYARKLMKVIDDYELSQYNFPELSEEVEEDTNEAIPLEATEKKEIGVDSIITKVADTIKVEQQLDTVKITDTLKEKAIIKLTDIVSSDTLIAKQFEKKGIEQSSIKIDTSIQLNAVKGIESTTVTSNTSILLKTNSLQLVVLDTPQKDTISKAFDIAEHTNLAVNRVIYSFPKEQLFQINKVNVLWVTAGSAYLEIATKYKCPLYKLFLYNEIKEADLVENDQLIFLAPKKKIGAKSIYTAQEGETLYEISQLNGIQLNSLKTYNPTIQTSKLKAGTIVYLFKSAEIKTAEKTAEKLTTPASPLFKKK